MTQDGCFYMIVVVAAVLILDLVAGADAGHPVSGQGDVSAELVGTSVASRIRRAPREI